MRSASTTEPIHAGAAAALNRATDPAGKLDIVRCAGYWLHDAAGQLTKSFRHICWDGCMFPNSTLENPSTWNTILKTMIAVRDAHGWA